MEFEPEEIEIIKIISKLGIKNIEIRNNHTKMEVLNECEQILREYHFEKTRGVKGKWTDEFERSGITEDEGKLAISYGRRIGMDIS